MRVKAVPRQRIIQNNMHVVSTSNCNMSYDFSEDSSTSNEEKERPLNYSTGAVDTSDKCKNEIIFQRRSFHTCLLNHSAIAGPSSRMCSNYLWQEDTQMTRIDDNNNNTLLSNGNLLKGCPMAGPSGTEYPERHQEDVLGTPVNDTDATKAINLSKKDCHRHVEESPSHTSAEPDNKFKDTFLYKIMTDPTFLESIQRSKQAKKYVCQYCKQEFVTSDELTNHMDVKKDNLNQVVCCACKKTFAQKRYLRYHQRCHSERTKFTCDICTKKYTRLDNLTRHNAFHINPDKFACPICKKTFARKDLLNKHEKYHDNKYRYYCEMCGKYFKGSLTLENHKRMFHSVA